MTKNVTVRFIECFKELKKSDNVSSDRQFCLKLNYTPQSWSKIKKLERSITVDLIRKATIIFKFNPVYIFTGVGDKFLKDEDPSLLTIAVDDNQNERILHIPVKAKAGYRDQFNDPVYLENLESFSLPGDYFKSGTHRSFEVEGDSMEPVLQNRDIIICSYVDDSALWKYNLRSGYVYVVITQNDIVVKRINNRINEDNCLELLSDNSDYPPIIVKIEDVKEIWSVKMKMSPFAHSKISLRQEMANNYSALHETIISQSEVIARLNKTVEKLLQKQRTL